MTLKIAVLAPMPESEGDHGDRGKARVLNEDAECEAQIVFHGA
jgi:hypothetical protein